MTGCVILVLLVLGCGSDDPMWVLPHNETNRAVRVLPTPVPAVTQLEVVRPAGTVEWWAFTFYSCQPREGFCGTTYSGSQVGLGDAACGWDVQLGTKVTILTTGETYTCTDRGKKVINQHIDVWFYHESVGWRWQGWVGSSGMVEIRRP